MLIKIEAVYDLNTDLNFAGSRGLEESNRGELSSGMQI